MTAIQPPLGITTLTDGTPAQHPAALFRRLIEVLSGGQIGVREAGDLAVTANATPNMTVNVAAGEALIPGTQQPASQGAYYVYNDAPVSLAVAASNAILARRDLVVARVYDRDYSGTIGEWRLEVVTGTAAVSPVDPATPADSILLARVAVAAGASSVSSGNITDLRTRLGQKAWLAAASSALTVGTTVADVPGASVAIAVPSVGSYLLQAVFDVHVTTTAAGVTIIGETVVDGAIQPVAALSSADKTRSSAVSLNLVELAAGTRTIKLTGRKDTASGVVNMQTHTRLAVSRVT